MVSDRVVMVTGGARRIGAELCRYFHARGYNIILHYNRSADDAEGLKNSLCAIRADSVRLWQSDLMESGNWSSSVLSFCRDQWGRLDLLINNASSFFPTGIGSVTEAQWDDLLGTNLKAPFFLTQALAPALKERAGSVINMIDIHGERPLKNYPVYSLAKAGLAMMTRSLAKELAPEVRVNGIAPGAILWPEDESPLEEKTRDTIIRQIPMKRQGAPEDVAKTAWFLAEEAPYVNGQILAVDGGRSLS